MMSSNQANDSPASPSDEEPCARFWSLDSGEVHKLSVPERVRALRDKGFLSEEQARTLLNGETALHFFLPQMR